MISTLGMGKAKRFVITGESAGGLATYTWVDYLSEKLKKINPNMTVYGIPDSGIFLDYPNATSRKMDFRSRFINFMELSNK